MRHPSLLLALLASSVISTTTVSLKADDLIGYWDVNSSYARSAGESGNLSVFFAEIGAIGGLRFGLPGTEENRYGSAPAGTAIEFHELINIVAVGIINVGNLDFSDYETPTVSFAYRKTVLFNIPAFNYFHLEYNTGSGWVKVADIPEAPENYGVYSYTFLPGVLDDLSNVSIRFHFREALEIDSSLFFDNIKVTATAIPEPGSVVFTGAAVLAAAGMLRRRRRLAD